MSVDSHRFDALMLFPSIYSKSWVWWKKWKNMPNNILVYFSSHKSRNYTREDVWSAWSTAESDSWKPQSLFFGWDHLHCKLPAAAFKAGWVRVAKLLLSLTLKQGNDTNITQNAITPHPVLFETQWSVKVNEGKCSVKPVRLHGLA